MVVQQIDIDTAVYMNITGIHAGFAWGIILQQTEDDGETPVDFTSSYLFVIYRDATRKDVIANKILTTNGNELRLGQLKSENKLFPKNTYHYEVYQDFETPEGIILIKGSLSVN